MVLKNINKSHIKKRLIGVVLISLFLFLGYLYDQNTQNIIPMMSSSSEINKITSKDEQILNPKNLSNPQQTIANDLASSDQSKLCQDLNRKYKNVNEVKKNLQPSTRYQNLHKRVDGVVYRLRFFYKDAAEGERLQFLVYQENENEEDILTETSPYKKGRLYNKVENALGEIIYFEEALTLGSNEETFLVYKNGQLLRIQEKNIECQF